MKLENFFLRGEVPRPPLKDSDPPFFLFNHDSFLFITLSLACDSLYKYFMSLFLTLRPTRAFFPFACYL